MFQVLKLAAVSAALAAALVTFTDRSGSVRASDARTAVAPAAAMTLPAPTPRLAPPVGCGEAAWPYAAEECRTTDSLAAGRRPVRTVALDRLESTAAARLSQLASR